MPGPMGLILRVWRGRMELPLQNASAINGFSTSPLKVAVSQDASIKRLRPSNLTQLYYIAKCPIGVNVFSLLALQGSMITYTPEPRHIMGFMPMGIGIVGMPPLPGIICPDSRSGKQGMSRTLRGCLRHLQFKALSCAFEWSELMCIGSTSFDHKYNPGISLTIPNIPT